MDYSHGTVTVTTSPTPIQIHPSNAGVLVFNNGAASVYFGGPNVTADQTANGGYLLPAATSDTIPTSGFGTHTLYAIVSNRNG